MSVCGVLFRQDGGVVLSGLFGSVEKIFDIELCGVMLEELCQMIS